jgi:hypothetical protein
MYFDSGDIGQKQVRLSYYILDRRILKISKIQDII